MKTLLIIDDSPFIAMEIKNIVSERGYEVVGHSRNGEEGIRKYDELRPDYVTIDIIMPGIDGIETAQKIREIDADAKIVMLSSLCDEETMKELEAAGLKYIVEKPIDADALMETVNSI
jgi:two-component system chemotaxis response regulator CheY